MATRTLSVCVRVRPLLDYEKEAKYFEVVSASHPKVYAFEPRFSVKGEAKLMQNTFDSDFAFGPQHSTDEIYETVVGKPIVSLGLKGGVCTVLAYGQTGSGKTFTITQLMSRLAKDLVEKKEDHIKLHLKVFEIFGQTVTDLLPEEGKEKKPVSIMEDKFGQVNVVNAHETEITSVEQFQSLVSKAMAHRKSATTFKNDQSSRTHAIINIRVVNEKVKEARDGKIFVIDLAGSENASDAQFHDKSRVKETQAINKSLMALKDCIRNRALSALNLDKYYHVPYRLSRLTLLLKDAFEVESHRHCKTIFIANVSPSVADISMSCNTLRYVTPLRIGQSNRPKVEPNPDNPGNWTNATLRDWVKANSNDKVDPEIFCPYESGMQILKIPETEFIERVLKANPGWGEKRAAKFNQQLWKLLIDARTKDRKTKLKAKTRKEMGRTTFEEDSLLMMAREANMTETEMKSQVEFQRSLTQGTKSTAFTLVNSYGSK